MASDMYLLDSSTIIHASKDIEGQIAKWIAIYLPYLTDVSYRECIEKWKRIDVSGNQSEREYLLILFDEAQLSGRYIDTKLNHAIWLRATELYSRFNIKLEDALIAATAEYFNLTLVTADVRRDFAPRLKRLTEQGLGQFSVLAYEYEQRVAFFEALNRLQS
jgi:predicted nucleic acid-binding protein